MTLPRRIPRAASFLPFFRPTTSSTAAVVTRFSRRTTVFALIAASGVLAAAATTSASSVSSIASAVPVPLSGAYLGILSELPGMTHAGSVALREDQVGRRFDIDSHYYDWTDTFPTQQESGDAAAGRIPMVTWWGTNYSSINNGSQDGLIRARAAAVKAFGRPLFLRWAAEMNGYWFAWGGAQNGNDPAGYVQAWRRIHDIFAAAGVTNVSWVWCPNADSNPAVAWNSWNAYYPGDGYVDWVGIDGYNFGTLLGSGDQWQSLGQIMGPVYAEYAPRKPIMIAETAATESGGSKTQWIQDASSWVKAHPAVRALLWFDRTVEKPAGAWDWQIDTSPSAASAFAQVARDPYFAPTLPSDPPAPPPGTTTSDTSTAPNSATPSAPSATTPAQPAFTTTSDTSTAPNSATPSAPSATTPAQPAFTTTSDTSTAPNSATPSAPSVAAPAQPAFTTTSDTSTAPNSATPSAPSATTPASIKAAPQSHAGVPSAAARPSARHKAKSAQTKVVRSKVAKRLTAAERRARIRQLKLRKHQATAKKAKARGARSSKHGSMSTHAAQPRVRPAPRQSTRRRSSATKAPSAHLPRR